MFVDTNVASEVLVRDFGEEPNLSLNVTRRTTGRQDSIALPTVVPIFCLPRFTDVCVLFCLWRHKNSNIRKCISASVSPEEYVASSFIRDGGFEYVHHVVLCMLVVS